MAEISKDKLKDFTNRDKSMGLSIDNTSANTSPALLPPITIAPSFTTTPPTTGIQKYLLPAAGVGIAYLLLTKGNKKSKLAGMKIGIPKDLGKKLLPELEQVSLVAGGMIASQKYLDLAMLADKLPDSIKTNAIVQKMVEHQGGVKLLIGIGVATATKNLMVKALAYGIAIGGLIKEIRTLTGGATSWIPSIGTAGSILPNVPTRIPTKAQSFNTVLNGNNPAMNRAQNGVLGMVAPTPDVLACGDYGSY